MAPSTSSQCCRAVRVREARSASSAIPPESILLLPTSALGREHLVVGYHPNAPMAAAGGTDDAEFDNDGATADVVVEAEFTVD